MPSKCAYDKNRNCDNRCTAFHHSDITWITTMGLACSAYKDRTTTKSRIIKDECKRGNFTIRVKDRPNAE